MKNKATLFGLFFGIASALPCGLTHAESNGIEHRHYGAWERKIGYTQVVKAGSTLYLSGLTSQADSMSGQLSEVYNRIESILKDYGLTTEHLIKETIYTRDIESLKKQIDLRKRFFAGQQYPAATWVQIERLYGEENLIEVDVIAYVPGSGKKAPKGK